MQTPDNKQGSDSSNVEAAMPTAAYVCFADAHDDDGDDDGRANIGALVQLLRSDPELPRPDTLLSLGSGAMAYFEHPARMLSFAHALWARARRADWPFAPLRAGIHLAPLTGGGGLESSLSTRTVDFATRIAGAASAGQILASREFHTVITRILKLDAGNFRPFGKEQRTSGTPLTLFEIVPPESGTPVAAEIAPEFLAAAERLLADEFGPLAKVLVRQAREASVDRDDLVRRIAESIPEGDRRESFLDKIAQHLKH